MGKTYKAIIAVFMAATALAGCQNEDPMKNVEEGLPVRLSFKVEVPKMEEITVTRATDEVETKIEKMAILFYNAKQENSKPVIVKVNDLGTPTQNTTTNYLYTVNLDEEQLDGVYSGEWYMYPVANYDKHVQSELSDLAGKTLKEFKEYTVTASGRDITATAVLMSGHYGTKESTITLQPGDNTFDDVFHLKRIVSKNIFTFKNGNGVTFTPQKYSIYNYSTSSTLLERDELNEYAGEYTGAADDTKGFTEFTGLPITDGTFTFYMPENVQTASKDGSWTYADRDRRNGKDDYDNFTYAPAKATYVVVEGTYSGPGENGEGTVTGNVKYTIHLGAFGRSDSESGSFDNFTVKRNCKYTYTITVNGVNSIIAEAKGGDESQPGAEGQIVGPNPHITVNLDAHYENVLLSFSANRIKEYSISATIPSSDGAMTSFLDINAADKATHTADVAWVKFGRPASSTTFANYPGDANVVDVYTLIEEVKSGSSAHCIIANNQVYVQAFVNEYFYDDKPYKDFVNTDDRILSFTIGTAAISEDGHSSYIEGEGFTLKQKSIKTFYNDKAGNPFGLESVEETPVATFSTDNYGADATQEESLQNGLKNTWGIVSDFSTSWTSFINISKNGFNGATAPNASDILTADGTNPLYECLSRNRDINGDGTIDENEVKWYLPAFRQYIYVWCGLKSLPTDISFDNTNYVSSTNAGYRIWWAKEGTAISSWDLREADPSIRCARNLGSSSTGNVSSITDWDATSNVVTVTGLKDEALRTNTQAGEYPEHVNTDAASTLPKAFKIGKNNLSADGRSTFKYDEIMTKDLCEKYYSEESDDLGKWRIPNEKELYFIQLYAGNQFDLSADDTDGKQLVGAKTKYERKTVFDKNNPKNTFMIYYLCKDMKSQTPIISTGHGKYTRDFTIRCVRDATPSSKSYDSSYGDGGTGFGL